MPPLVSVLIPCFNNALYLEKAVVSVLAQTYTNFECIIVDDGSTDNTRQVSESLMKRDSRVKYLFKEHGGLYPTRNFAISHSKGEWIQFLDADDWLHEDKINFHLSYLDSLEGNDDDIVFYSDYVVVRQDDNQNDVEEITNIIGDLTNEQLLERTMTWNFKPNIPLHINSVLFKKTVFSRKMFDEDFRAFGDQELFVDLLLKDISFTYTPIIGMYYRQHQYSMSTRRPSLIRKSYVQWLEAIYEKDKSLLRNNPNILKLLKRAFRIKDRDGFNRLLKLIDVQQMPIYLLNGRIRIKNKFLLKLAFLIRSFIPKSISKYVSFRKACIARILFLPVSKMD